MTFWIRHLTLLILCVVVPLGASIYFDTESEISRAKIAGAKAARLGERSLAQRLQLDAHNIVGDALNVARQISEQQILDDLSKTGRKKDLAIASAQELVARASAGGFAWLIDPEGRIVWKSGATDLDESPRSIAGHPLFVKTQLGLAFDAFWHEDGLSLVGAAPVTGDGRAAGAVVLGRKIDAALVSKVADSLGVNLTVVSGDSVVATTIGDPLANVVALTKSSVDPVYSGRLEKPLQSGSIPLLPILIDKHAGGLAFASFVHTAPAGPVRWIVSVPSAESLQDLWQRQEILLGVLIASLMLALLVGLLNYRTFVTPIETVADHLSNIQLGRGEVELAEAAVSSPFRRLVKLVNMTVQKMPTRSFPSVSISGESSPISELPSLTPDTGDLMEGGSFSTPAPARRLEAAPPADISMFPPAPPSKVAPPAKKSKPVDDEAAAVEEAIASMSLSGMSAREIDQQQQHEGDSAEAIAEAIASLEAQQRAAADVGLSAPSQPRSASTIRGATPGGESPFMPSQSEYFRAGSHTSGEPSPVGESFIPPSSAVQRGAGLRSGGSLSAPAGLGSAVPPQHSSEFSPESTVVAAVQQDLLEKSARDEFSGEHSALEDAKPDATVVASVPADLLAQTAGEAVPDGPGDSHGLDASDHAHFKQVYERFVDMRRKCGEGTSDLAFDRFLTKLTKNREALMKKYSCRTVRFQVYEKDGKAALKATPVRAR